MGERVVIADLVFQEEGALLALRKTDSAIVGTGGSLDTLAKRANSTAGVFTNRMFSMRTAAVAFLGGFTLAGVILQMKNMVVEVAKGDDAFKRFTTDASVFKRVIEEMPAVKVTVHASLVALDAILRRLSISLILLKEHPIDALFTVGASKIAAVKEAEATFNRMVNDMQKVAAFKRTDESILLAPFGGKVGLDAMLDADFQGISGALSRFSPFADQAAASTERLHQAMLGVKSLDVGGEFAQSFKRASIEVIAFRDHTQLTVVALEAVGVSLQAASAGIAQLIIEGGSGRDLFANVLKQLSVAMFAKAAEYAAYGIAASTGIGAVTLGGTPAQFFAAAGEFAAAGAAAGLIGRAASDRGRGSSSHGIAAAPASGRTINVTNVIQGSVFGVGQTKEQFAAEQAELIKKALSDGAAGGSLASGWQNG